MAEPEADCVRGVNAPAGRDVEDIEAKRAVECFTARVVANKEQGSVQPPADGLVLLVAQRIEGR